MRSNRNRLSTFRHELIDRIVAQEPNLAGLRDVQLKWYRIVNESKDKAQVYIYDSIGGSLGVRASEFVKELNEITAPQIDIHINSPGGSIFDGIAIGNSIQQHSSKTVGIVDSLAASIASVITISCGEVEMREGSQMMIHDALGMEFGTAEDMRKMATFLDRQSDNIARTYLNKAGGTLSEWRDRMLAETWMFADEAVELGLADRVAKRAKVDDNGSGENDDGEGDDDDVTLDEISIEALMQMEHDLSRFLYNGRENAPSPKKDQFVNVGAAIQNAMRKVRV